MASFWIFCGAKTQLALLEPQLETARNQLKTDATNLANLLGDQQATQIRVTGELETPPLEQIKARVDLRQAHVPEYESVITSEERLEKLRAATLGKDMPSLAATADWGRNAYTKTDVLDPSATFWQVGIQLTVPIFSGLSSVYTRRDFDSQAEQLAAQQGPDRQPAFHSRFRSRA